VVHGVHDGGDMTTDHLSRDEELALVDNYRRTHDPRLEERLVRSQLGLVHKLAGAHQLEGLERSDLVQEGALGLLHAIRRFDPEHGTRLSTYAAWWIRAYQYRHIMQNCRLVRLGTSQTQRRLFFRIRALRAKLAAAGLEATPERLAALFGVGAVSARSMAQRLDAHDLSLDAPVRAGEPRSIGDNFASETMPADELTIARETASLVRQERDRYRATLGGRRRELFDARWLDEEQPTLQEMATRFGVSRERTRQIEQSMLQVLRKRLQHQVA
jgi:RNA polymerase sigma-32 factor